MVKNYQLCIVREQNMQQNDSESRRNYFCQHQKIVPSPQPPSVEKLVQNWYIIGSKLVHNWYKIGKNTNFQIFSRSEKLIHHQLSSLVYQLLQSLLPKIGKKVPISW